MMFFVPIELQTFSNNQHVSVELRSPEKILISAAGELVFFLTPNEGIHINTNPIFELRLEKNSPFEVVGNPLFQKNDKEYLDHAQPVRFSIKPKKGSTFGKQSLKGKLNYFYCSDRDGWCNRFTQPIELRLEIVK